MPALSIESIPLLISVTISIALTLIVFLNNPKSATNQIFSALSICIIGWLIANYLSVAPAMIQFSLHFIRASFVLAMPLSTLLFLFAYTIPAVRIKLSSLELGSLAFITCAISYMATTPLLVSDVSLTRGTPSPVMGPGILIFSLYSTFFSVAAIVILWKRYTAAKGEERQQYLSVLVGIILMLGLIIATVLIPTMALGTNIFVSFIPFYTLCFQVFTAFAIARQRLLDIRPVVSKTIAYILLIGSFGFLYSFTIAIGTSRFTSAAIHPVILAISTVLTLMMAFSFQYAKQALEKLTDRFLYRNRYDAAAVLYDLSRIMASSLRMEDLTHGLLTELRMRLHITRAGFILMQDNVITSVASEGFDSHLDLYDDDMRILGESTKAIVFDELEDSIEKDILRTIGLSIAMPLRTEGSLIGLFVLGEKASGDIYSTQDVHFLSIVASESAVAIQNALAYEEIRRFNITLKDEIDRATTDLKAANEKLELLDKLKDEFVSVASHELRTPMTAIKSYTWLVLHGKAGPLTPKAQEYIDRVYQSTERLIHLVNEMLDVSRIEGGRVKLSLESFDPAKLLTDIREEFTARTSEKNIHLSIEPDSSITELSADREKIHQVLENLIGNALKFTPQGGTIAVGMHKNGTSVEFQVTDSGMGIRAEDLPKLFQKFGRLENSLVAMPGNSTGLGLYISKQYVELHSGTINVTSVFGKGSTFSFTLPIRHPQALQAP